jgi:hypothetical protein
MEHQKGSVVVVEADPGAGKTSLIAHFATFHTLKPMVNPSSTSFFNKSSSDNVSSKSNTNNGGEPSSSSTTSAASQQQQQPQPSISMRGLPPPFFLTAAVPFHPRAFGVWCTIIMQALDFLATHVNASDGDIASGRSGGHANSGGSKHSSMPRGGGSSSSHQQRSHRREARSAAETLIQVSYRFCWC